MTQEKLIDAITDLDSGILNRYFDMKADLAAKKKPKKRTWVKWASLAACFALIITASMLLYPSVVEDISSDGYENLFLFGGITVNMNSIFWAFFIAPVFSVVCTFLMWLIDSGSIILPLWLIRDLCIPILHFCILKRCIKKNKIQKKSTIWLVIALLLVTVAADSFVLEYLILKGRLAIPHIIFRLIWAILCGLFVLGHTLVERFYRNNIHCNIMVAVGSTIALCINAFMTYLLAPTLATKYAIDGIELLLMPLSIIILSVYSHLLGRIMTRRFMFVKLTGWLLGIIASEFVTLWLLGTPRILPTEDKVTTIIWIVVSAFVFIWCLIGVLKTHLEDIKQSLAEKRKPTNRTWVKWASLAACLCLVVMVGVFTIPNLIGYHSGLSEDEIFERSNTYFDNYDELAAIIGNDTLLENIDFATLNDYELRLVHELDNVNDYHAVSFVNIMPEDEFGFGIHFPPYNKKTANFVGDGETTVINGITVQYEKRRTEGSNFKYDIAAEFEFNGCFYQIRSTGNSDESVFWDNLNALLGVQ